MSKPQMIFAIDPGPTHSGWVLFDAESFRVLSGKHESNQGVAGSLVSTLMQGPHSNFAVAVEMVSSYGMPVGKEVFETVWWAGRFHQMALGMHGVVAHRILRGEVKLHLCKSSRAKDANVRQALLDLFPATGGGKTPQVGTKTKQGPLYGVSGHLWPALGVAVTLAAEGEDATYSYG